MNTTEPHFNYVRPASAAQSTELAESQPMVEHLTVTEFMSRIPHPTRWHLDDINRFGDKVGWTANSIQLARMMVQSDSLGLIRVFPVPLLMRIYTVIAPQFNWPKLPELLPGRAPRRDADERLAQHLQASMVLASEPEVRESIGNVLRWLDERAQANRAQA